MPDKQNKKVFFGWYILAVATFALAVSNGLAIGGFPVFFKPIREDFVNSGAVAHANSESFIALGATLTFLTAGLIGPLAGWFVQRFAVKRVMLFGCLILGAGLLVHSRAESTSTVYISRILMGASLGFVGVLANVVLVSNWFVRKRGTALGILLTGTSLGGVIFAPLAAYLITQFGWRNAMSIISLVIWFALVPAIIAIVRSRPVELGLDPDGDVPLAPDVAETTTQTEGMTLGQALRTPIFWIFALCAALVFYPIFVTSQQFILYLQSPKIGLSPQEGSLALSALFIVSVLGKSAFGSLSDRLAPARVMLICCSVMFLATLVLLALTAKTALAFLIPFGLGYGGTFVLLQRLVADLFGNRDYPKILGVITVVETVGAAIGGLVTGKLADAAGGDYSTAFFAVIAVTAVALALVVILNLLTPQKRGSGRSD